jgi:hypothetical protein
MTDDPLARLRAEMDQAREGVKEFMGTLRAFYSTALEEGFSEEAALRLTRDFLIQSLRNVRGDDE